MLEADRVLQPGARVVKPYDLIGNDQRFDALESQIAELKSILLNYNVHKDTQLSKEERESKAEGEIRTRVVASTGPF